MRAVTRDELPATYEDKKADRARKLLVESLRLTDTEQRVQKAKQALSHWSGCAEAYVMLAQCEVDLPAGSLRKGNGYRSRANR